MFDFCLFVGLFVKVGIDFILWREVFFVLRIFKICRELVFLINLLFDLNGEFVDELLFFFLGNEFVEMFKFFVFLVSI